MTKTSIRAHEAAHFGSLAGDWWDPNGASAMLHKLNPVRLGYIPTPTTASNCALGGLDGRRLFITAETHLYALDLLQLGT